MTKMFCASRWLSPIRALALALTALGVANPVSVQALDFRLRHFQEMVDGQMVDHTCFHYDDRTEILLDLPLHWSTSSAVGGVISSPTTRPSDEIRVEKSVLTPDTPFQEKGLEAYRQRLLATVPQGAQNIRLVGELADPFPMFGWKDYEFVLDYDIYGRSIRRGVSYINVNPKLQVTMTITSAPDTFADLRTTAFRVLRTWTPVPAEARNPPVN